MSLQDKLTSQTNYTQFSTQEVSLFQGYTKELKLTIPVAYTDSTYKLRTVIKAGTIESFSSSSPDLVNFETTITSADTTIILASGNTVNIPVGNAVMDLIITKDTAYIPYGRFSVSCLKPNYASGSAVIPPDSSITAGQVLYMDSSNIIKGIDTASGTDISDSNKPVDEAYLENYSVGYNVKFDFGAEGDNTANDTTAFQNALNAIANDGGGKLYVPKGVYLVGQLDIYDNTVIVGEGFASVLKLNTDGTMFSTKATIASPNANYRQGHEFYNLKFDLNKATNTTTAQAIYAYKTRNLVVEHCYFENWNNKCINVAGDGTNFSIQPRITNNWFDNGDRTNGVGIQLDAGSFDSTLQQNDVGRGYRGIVLSNGGEGKHTLIGNWTWGNEDAGLYLFQSDNVIISSHTADKNFKYGFYIQESDRIMISNCLISNNSYDDINNEFSYGAGYGTANTYDGLYVEDSIDVIVNGGSINNPSSTQRYGVVSDNSNIVLYGTKILNNNTGDKLEINTGVAKLLNDNTIESTITATTSADYYRGDKTFQTLNKTAVGLANVDNTTDLNKPISTATQTALNARVLKAGDTMTGNLTVGGNVASSVTGVANVIAQGNGTGSTFDYSSVTIRNGNDNSHYSLIHRKSPDKNFSIQWYDGVSTFVTRLQIKDDGDIGIGTTTPGSRLDVRKDLGTTNDTNYNVARISRDGNNFLNLGYRGDGSGVGSYIVNATDSKGLVLGTTGDTSAISIAGGTGNVTINKPTTVDSLTITNDTSKANIGLVNGRLAVSVASGTLTISVVGNDGNAPSATNKVEIWLPDAGAIFTKKTITSALSLSMATGTNWMDLGSTMNRDKKINLALYIGIDDDGDVYLGAGRLYGATKGAVFNNTSTSYKYARFTGGENPANISAMTSVGRVTVEMNSSNAFQSVSANNDTIIQYPIYSSGTMSWEPTYGASGSMTYTSVTTGTASYTMHNNIITYNLMARGTTGGTAAKRLTASIPIIYDTGSAPSFPVGVLRSGCYVRDASDSSGYVNIDSQSTVMEFGLNGEVDWSLDNGKDIGLEISFPIY